MEIKIKIEELKKRRLFLATPMYGGINHGLYAKSVADLTAKCAELGIQLVTYFLFNESLITRARNYCADEFLRSQCTHMLFIDSDIGFRPDDVIAMLAMMGDDSEYDVMCAPYPKKSCHYNTKITTENGVFKLGKLVRERYTGKVLSYSDAAGFEFKPVLAHFKTKANGKQWVQLLTRDSFGKLTVTHDHEIATVDDIFNPMIIYRNAIDMEGRTLVRVPRKTNNRMTKENVAFSAEQLQFLYGTLLGDSTIRKNGQITCSHSSKSREYAELKAELFGLNQRDVAVKLGEKTHNTITLFGGTNTQTKQLREMLYVNGKKTVKNIVDKLDVASFAMMYMDDGYYHTKSKVAMLCTEGFEPDDIKLLQNRLQQLGYSTGISPPGNNGIGSRIRFHVQSTKKFFTDIAKYVIPTMEYKMPNEYHSNNKFDYSRAQKLNYVLQKCKRVVKLNQSFDQYDITVADNFNFVTQGTLVHNCIAWEKIKKAVDKGFADENPNNLEKFVGDYVFNAKPGTTSFQIHQPVEILEGGTGFMMIRRSTFERYQKAFPELMYRPDHVRAAAFDGSREIMAFFDCIIDRGYVFDDVKKLMKDLAVAEPSHLDSLKLQVQKMLDAEKVASKRYLSEDYMFCQNIIRIGGKIWLCPWMITQHTGSFVFGGSLSDLAALGTSATADINEMDKIKKAQQKSK